MPKMQEHFSAVCCESAGFGNISKPKPIHTGIGDQFQH